MIRWGLVYPQDNRFTRLFRQITAKCGSQRFTLRHIRIIILVIDLK